MQTTGDGGVWPYFGHLLFNELFARVPHCARLPHQGMGGIGRQIQKLHCGHGE